MPNPNPEMVEVVGSELTAVLKHIEDGHLKQKPYWFNGLPAIIAMSVTLLGGVVYLIETRHIADNAITGVEGIKQETVPWIIELIKIRDKHLTDRMDSSHENIDKTLGNMNERLRDIQSLLLELAKNDRSEGATKSSSFEAAGLEQRLYTDAEQSSIDIPGRHGLPLDGFLDRKTDGPG